MAAPALLLEGPRDAANLSARLQRRLDTVTLAGAGRVLAVGLDGQTGVQVTMVAFASLARRDAFRDGLADLVADGLVARSLESAARETAGLGLLFP